MLRAQLFPQVDDETARLEFLLDLDLSPSGYPGMEDVCDLASAHFNIKTACVTLLRSDVQHAYSTSGVVAFEIPREQAFCNVTVAERQTLVVNDARADPRFANNPLVTGAPYIQFYAGAPLILDDGTTVGAFCLIGHTPRSFDDDDRVALTRFARIVTRQLQSLQRLRLIDRREALLEQTAQLVQAGGWEYNIALDRLTLSNQVCEIFGVSRHARLTCDTLLNSLYTAESRRAALLDTDRLLKKNQKYDAIREIVRPDGRRRWIRVLAATDVEHGRPSRVLGAIEDITAQRDSTRKLHELAYTDALTGLSNRAAFKLSLQDRLQYGMRVVMLMINVDQFKDINDTLGHHVGDRMLVEIGRRLKAAFPEAHSVARLGGDEFAILTSAASDDDVLANELDLLQAVMAAPLVYQGSTYPMTVSIGAALAPDDASTAEGLLKNADIAMSQAKAQGTGRALRFQPPMLEQIEARVQLLRDVRDALDRQEFELHYQPIIDLRTQRLAGFEGLMRWAHPVLGVMAPASFMAALNDPAIGPQLGRFALRAAMAQMRNWLDAGLNFGRMSVNLATAQFLDRHLADDILGMLASANLSPSLLMLEVTEGVYIGSEADAVQATVQCLHSAGVGIALDDFGTGYASLAHLRRFPIDRLKVDKSFVQRADDISIVESIIGLGLSLNMEVVAEGIEDQNQLAGLKARGCHYGQGYLFARPLPARELDRALFFDASRVPAPTASRIATA